MLCWTSCLDDTAFEYKQTIQVYKMTNSYTGKHVHTEREERGREREGEGGREREGGGGGGRANLCHDKHILQLYASRPEIHSKKILYGCMIQAHRHTYIHTYKIIVVRFA